MKREATQMFKLLAHLKKVGEVRYDIEFYNKIEISKQGAYNIKSGDLNFTLDQIRNAIIHYQNTAPDLANPYFLLNIPLPKTKDYA